MGADPTRRAIVAGVPLALLTVHPAFRTRVWAQAPSTGRLIVQRAVPLARILERAGLTPSAREVVLEGADRGKPAFAPEEVAFAKSLPLEKALHPDTLLVYAMNGVPLPREHGGPVRAVVPGWYGTYH